MNVPNVVAIDEARCHDCDWVYRPHRRLGNHRSGTRTTAAARTHAWKLGHRTSTKHIRRWETAHVGARPANAEDGQ